MQFKEHRQVERISPGHQVSPGDLVAMMPDGTVRKYELLPELNPGPYARTHVICTEGMD